MGFLRRLLGLWGGAIIEAADMPARGAPWLSFPPADNLAQAPGGDALRRGGTGECTRTHLCAIPGQGPCNGTPRPSTCYGCAHSAATAPYPGVPAGERPCMLCKRNPEQAAWNDDFEKQHGMRYDRPTRWNDGTLFTEQAPLDMYIATDRLMEERNLRRLAALHGNQGAPTIEDSMAQMSEAFRDMPAPRPPQGNPRDG